MATLGHALLRHSLTFILEHLPHPPTHLNLFFLTAISLSHTRKLLVDRLQDLIKNCKRQCISGYACGQRNFFARIPHIDKALGVMNMGEIVLKMTHVYCTYPQ
jgi:hypothetical protein